MTRELSCRAKLSQEPEEYKTVNESSCKEPKPKNLQKVCYKIACPAEWVPSPWGEVRTPSNGGVLIHATVQEPCRRSSGNFELVGSKASPYNLRQFSPEMFRNNQFTCNTLTDVALFIHDFLQCSKTCQGGIITRTLSCKKLDSDGQYSPLPKIFCQNAVKPPVSEECNYDIPCSGS